MSIPAYFPSTLLLCAPGVSALESLHLMTSLEEQHINDFYGQEPDPEPSLQPQGEMTMNRTSLMIRELAVPFAIFIGFFALPVYTYMAIAT